MVFCKGTLNFQFSYLEPILALVLTFQITVVKYKIKQPSIFFDAPIILCTFLPVDVL